MCSGKVFDWKTYTPSMSKVMQIKILFVNQVEGKNYEIKNNF